MAVFFPEFITALWHPVPIGTNTSGLGAAMGMVLGIPIGAAAMFAGRLVTAVHIWAESRNRQTTPDTRAS